MKTRYNLKISKLFSFSNKFERDIVALKPNWVSICISINDEWRQFDCPAMYDAQVMPDEYKSNLEKMKNV